MDQFIQLLFTGLTNGAIYALVALGFVLIYKSTEVINFAQGELLLVGAYLTFGLVADFGLAWPIGVLITLALAACLGVIVERLVLRPLIGEPIISVIMVTIGLSSLLRAFVSSIWGTAPRSFPAFIPSNTLHILGAAVPSDRLVAIGLAVLLLTILTMFFRRPATASPCARWPMISRPR